MISRETIDKVFETARVEEVIGDFLQMKRAGSNYKALSPFSDERTPSFMVSPVKQIWKDFSTGKGGNAVTFLMEHEHFTYPEAIRYLAKKYNIEIEETVSTEEEIVKAGEKESLYVVSEFAQKFFHDTLLNSEEGKAIGLTYFKERGFTNETITKFGLGYSPEMRDALTKQALKEGYQLEYLEKTGLTIVSEDAKFDRFRGRVMFPIQSMSGRVLGFGGRILSSEKKAAKYLNSPESEIYNKSKVLYGIFHAKQAIAKLNNCFLVEGYTDVIQLHQSGIENVVASSGTALTPDQIRLISRLTKNITVLFDGDAAGLRASIRGIDLILEEGMNVRVCTFPDGEDPDSFARNNSHQDVVKYLEDNSKDFIQFKSSLLMNEAKNDPIKKAELIRDMVESISKIPDRIKREVYIQECSRIMDISEQVLLNSLAQILRKNLLDQKGKTIQDQKAFEVFKSEKQTTAEKVNIIYSLERKLIEILLLYGNEEDEFEDVFFETNEEGDTVEVIEKNKYKVYNRVYMSLQDDEIELADQEFREIYQNLITWYTNEEGQSIEQFIQQLDEEHTKLISDILMEDEKETLHDWEKKHIYVKHKKHKINQYVTETIISLREYLINRLIVEIMENYSQDGDTDANELLVMVNDYNKLKVALTKKIGRIRSIYK